MRLCYRGVPYDYNPIPIETAESQIEGQYRGQAFIFPYPKHIPVPQPVLSLKYRGVAYHTTPTGGVENVVSAAIGRQPITGASRFIDPVFSFRQASSAAIGKVHSENIQRRLQHRLAVAQSKGDESLIHQLEREMQQIV